MVLIQLRSLGGNSAKSKLAGRVSGQVSIVCSYSCRSPAALRHFHYRSRLLYIHKRPAVHSPICTRPNERNQPWFFVFIVISTPREYRPISVWLSARITCKPQGAELYQLLSHAVARSSTGVVAKRYVLPVLWMMSCLHVIPISGDRIRRT